MSLKFEQVHLFVSGRVQGVGFRRATHRVAASLALGGWVRNLPDSRVEIVAHGEAEKLDALLKWCAAGPRGAEVERVEIVERSTLEGEAPPSTPFQIR